MKSKYCDLLDAAAAALFKAFNGDLVNICILLELGGGGGGIIFVCWEDCLGKVKELPPLIKLGLGNGGGTGGGIWWSEIKNIKVIIKFFKITICQEDLRQNCKYFPQDFCRVQNSNIFSLKS